MSDTDYRFSWVSLAVDERPSISQRGVPLAAVTIAMSAAEVLLILAGSALGPLVYGRIHPEAAQALESTLGVGVLACACYACIAASWRLYSIPILVHPWRYLRRILAASCLALLMLTAVLFLLKDGSSYSRGAVCLFAATMIACCCLTRLAAARLLVGLLEAGRLSGRPTFVVGEPTELVDVVPRALLVDFGLEERGRWVIRAGDDATLAENLKAAVAASREVGAREVLLALNVPTNERLSLLLHELRASPLPVRLLHQQPLRALLARRCGMPDSRFDMIDLQRAPLSQPEQIAKRVFDFAGALVGLILFAPLLIVAALAVRFDSPGPILFWQKRNGYNRNPFRICKFRTMTVLEDGLEVQQARRNDQRVTRVGRILRSTSIDELPQLWNVLKGEMSLVGPRPHALVHDHMYSELIGDYSLRHHVKPGITGWAQVNGHRGETRHKDQMRARIELDLWYINKWSIALDMQILFLTMAEVLRHDAY